MLKILVTGSTGRLGQYIIPELKQYFDVEAVGIEHWDFTYPLPEGKYDLILHMGAYTDVKKAEKEQNKCFQINAFGTFQLIMKYLDTPFVYISTEYAKNPIGVYALTKQLGEEIVKYHPHHLILRTAFKPTPWPFPKAYKDQMTQGDYVDVIAKVIATIVAAWDRKTSRFAFAGTGRKTMYDLAVQTRPDVTPNTVAEYIAETGAPIPYDYLDDQVETA